ncbi:hypothetical protein [Aquiflexum sp.]
MPKYIVFEKAYKEAFYKRRNDAKRRDFFSFLTDLDGINSAPIV